MAIAWKDVIAKPEYQALSPQQQAEAQTQYFNDVVAPAAGDQAQQAAAQFFAQYPLPGQQGQQEAPQQPQQPQGAQMQPAQQQAATMPQAQQIPAGGAPPSQDPSVVSQIMQGGAEAGRSILQAGANTFNIIPEMGDAVVSAAAWAAQKMGIGDGTYTPATRATLPQSLQPQTEVGKIASDAIPYLVNPVSGAERAALNVANTTAGRIAARAGGSVSENVFGALAQNSGAQSGTDQGVQSFATDLGTGALASGAVRGLAAGAGAAYRGARSAITGAGRETAGANAVVPDYASPQVAADTVAPAQSQAAAAGEGTEAALRDVIQDSGTAARTSPGGTQSFAAQINPDEQVLESARRLGVDDALTPGSYSQNPAYRAFENAMGSLPSRETYHAQRAAIGRLGEAADTFINDFGGSIDKSFANQQVVGSYNKLIGGIKEQEGKLYQTVRDAIPTRAPVEARNTVDAILSYADDLGGVDNLPAVMKGLLKRLDNPDATPTYGLLDYARKEIGNAGSGRGAFKDEQSAMLDRLYGALSDDQGAAAASFGARDAWQAAKAMSSQRFAVQDAAKSALGKDLQGDVISKMQQELVNMAKGSGTGFKNLVNNLPPDVRQQAVVTAMNKAFTTFAKSPGQQIGVPGFYKWYTGMSRNKSNMQALSRTLGYEATKRLSDLAQVAKGMQRLGSEKIYSASQIDRLLSDFDKGGGLVSKLYDAGRKIGTAEGLSSSIGLPGLGTASVVGGLLTAQKTSAVQAADKMLASQAFRSMTKSNVSPAARAAAERQLVRSSVYRDWYDQLSAENARAVSQKGFLEWLSDGQEPATQAQQQQ